MGEWREYLLRELVRDHDSARRPVKSADRAPGPVPYYGASGIVDCVEGHTHEGNFLLVAEDDENLRSRSTPVAFRASGRIWANNHVHVLSGIEEHDTAFLGYALAVADISGYLTGSAQPKLNKSALESIRLHLPASAERRAISELLVALDDKIAANDRISDIIRDLLSARFDALGIDRQPAHDSESLAITDVVELNPRTPLTEDDHAVYLDMKNLPESAMTVSNWTCRKARGGARFMNGDTLLARITPCLENGKTGFVDFLQDGQVGIGSTEFIVMRPTGAIPMVLPYFLAKSSRFREYSIRHMVGSSGRQRLSAGDLKDFVLTQPSQTALAAFGELADPLMKRVRSCIDESRLLARTRDELLPLLMSGKVRVKDAEAAVSELL